MASTWGNSWALAWGGSWGALTPAVPPSTGGGAGLPELRFYPAIGVITTRKQPSPVKILWSRAAFPEMFDDQEPSAPAVQPKKPKPPEPTRVNHPVAWRPPTYREFYGKPATVRTTPSYHVAIPTTRTPWRLPPLPVEDPKTEPEKTNIMGLALLMYAAYEESL